MEPTDDIATEHPHPSEWQELRGHARHQTVEVLRLILILIQDAVILVAGFVAEFVYEHWLHSSEPFFQFAVRLSSALFLLLYGITVTVHVVSYVRGQLGATKATMLGQYLPWALAGCGLIIGIALTTTAPRSRPADTPATSLPVMRFAITLPPGDRIGTSGNGPVLDLSKDGTKLVFRAVHNGVPQLFLREMSGMQAQPLEGTETTAFPFFSPDGRFLAFTDTAMLKKIPIAGGPSQPIDTVAADMGGGIWTQSNGIVYARTGSDSLRVVSPEGGRSTQLLELKGGNGQRWPEMLPDGKTVLFVNWIATGDASQIMAERTDTHERKVLIQGGTYPRYSPTGHLLFIRGATLMAVSFDVNRLEITGSPVPVVEGVMETPLGAAWYSISGTGTLAYVAGGILGVERSLVWVSRNGAEQQIPAPARSYQMPKLSPDGKSLALIINGDVWLYALERGTLTRLTFEGGNLRPLWSPDNKYVAYESNKGGKPNLWWKLADGTGDAEQLTNSDYFFLPSSISPQLVGAYVETHPGTNRDLYMVPLSGDRKPRPWLQTPFDESLPLFSPDGKWISYVSNETGRFEVYVRPASGTGGKWQISTDGGMGDTWSPDGKGIFYQDGNKMYAVDVQTSPTFSSGRPRLLFEGVYEKQGGVGPNYNVSPDGQRFLMIKPGGVRDEGVTQINVVLNWFEELKQKVPLK